MSRVLWGLGLGLLLGVVLHRAALPLVALGCLLTGATAFNLVQGALWPSGLAGIRQELEDRLLRSFLLGLLALVSGLGVALVLQPPLRGLWALLMALGFAGSCVPGGAALASLVGSRIAPQESPVRQLMAGSLTLGLSLLLPVVGWVAVLGLMLAAWGATLSQLRVPRLEVPAAPRPAGGLA